MTSQLAPENVRTCLEACTDCAVEAEACAQQCIAPLTRAWSSAFASAWTAQPCVVRA